MTVLKPDGTAIRVSISKDSSVLQLMEEIARVNGVCVAEQRLVHGGKQLNRKQKLSEAGVSAYSVVTLVVRLFGGR